MRYAEIILPIAGETFTFGVDAGLEKSIAAGSAVSVQFGARKIVGGIVRKVHDETPPYKKIKPVLSLLFPRPVVSSEQMRLWEWMAGYYMCSLGEIMRAALPALLKPSGFTAREFAADEFRVRTVRFVRFAPRISGEREFNEVCEALRRRAPRQYDTLVELAEKLAAAAFDGGEVPRAELKAEGATLAALQKKGIVLFSEREAADISADPSPFRLPVLSPAQQTALDALRTTLRDHKVGLLFGVPASGKSEVAFHAIAGTLSRERDVLLLLPEISLTTQFVQRVRRVFGERVVLYHSALGERRRADAWIRLTRSEGGSLILGTRSAIFLPMARLGLVVVDEEQDSSYKQQDPAPRYNARDTAIVLAGLHNAKVILASATPSLETWANASSGKYGLVELSERWGGTLPPEVTISDTIRAAKRGERRSHFNKDMLEAIGDALSKGRQAILFQNRRGIAPFIECTDCGHVPKCGHCGIPMSVHRGSLRCHYCGAGEPLPSVCPSCGSMNLTTRGFGTEKIEEELARLFPGARIARLDRDSAASERAYSRIIGDFEAGATDILVGTQMVTKGLDFKGVSLVGVLNADNLVNHPDFRASERAYQLIAQVAGRAGRDGSAGGARPDPSWRNEPVGGARGRVVIQTASPGSRIINQAAAGDYRAMAAELLAERATYGYPPSSRLVEVMLRHPSRDVLDAAARHFGELLRAEFNHPAPPSPAAWETTGQPPDTGSGRSVSVLGPQPPMVEKIKGEYALLFLLKAPRRESMSAVRDVLQAAARTLLAERALRKTSVTFNVDPM